MAAAAIGVDTHKATLAACLVDGRAWPARSGRSPTTRPGTRRSRPGRRGSRSPACGSGSRAPPRSGRPSPGTSSRRGSRSSRSRPSCPGGSAAGPGARAERSRGRVRDRPGDPGRGGPAPGAPGRPDPGPPAPGRGPRHRGRRPDAGTQPAPRPPARPRPGYGATVARLVTGRELAQARQLLRRRHGIEADLARAELAEVVRLGRRADALERQIRPLLADDPLLAIAGCGPLTAAVIRGEAGDVARFPSHDALAMFVGVAPLPACSGKTSRVRYNRRGNRRVNRAIWTIAVWQAKFDPRARAYLARKRAEGKRSKEALRCLKRHLVRHVFAALVAGHQPAAIDPLTP